MDHNLGEAKVDPIKVSVISNRLDAICKEIGETMMRTSRSPIFSESRDFVTAVFDKKLRLVAQKAYIPVIMGCMPHAIESIAAAFVDDIEEGDIFILNDPYHGNNHPPDITIAKPVFWKGKPEFWAVSKGHHADVGGGGVTGYNPEARSIWDECIRIPPAKLYSRGSPNKVLWEMILLNIRLRMLVEGDLNCQVGACRIGERGLLGLLEKHGPEILDAALDEILEASERQMRAAIREVPNGRYSAERFIDHDGIDKGKFIPIRLSVVVSDEKIAFDFTGSAPQVRGYVNSTLANTASSAYLALFLSVGSEVRFDEGALRAIEVIAPLGTVVHAVEPAAVTGCTIAAAQAIIEAAWMAIAQAVPERVYAGWARWCAPASMGFNPRTGRAFGEIHFMSKGGGGAAQGVDGWDHIGTVVCAGGSRAPDPELHELVDPYTVLQYEYWQDSAGPGEWRGGMGTVYRWRVDADDIQVANFGGGLSEATAPFGLEGGCSPPPSVLVLHHDGETASLDTESLYRYGTGDVYDLYQSGGGGYGDPMRRPVQKVLDDVLDGLVSVDAARKKYGVVIEPNSCEVDSGATARLRG